MGSFLVLKRFQRPTFLFFLLILSNCSGSRAQVPQRTSQVQVTREFLLAILHKEDARAYKLLAPETTKTMSMAKFKQVVKPLYEQGKRLGPAISLYRLGMRMGGQGTRYFYDFSFKSDSLRAKPQVVFDVTFRDSVATRIMSFGQIPAPQRK